MLKKGGKKTKNCKKSVGKIQNAYRSGQKEGYRRNKLLR